MRREKHEHAFPRTPLRVERMTEVAALHMFTKISSTVFKNGPPSAVPKRRHLAAIAINVRLPQFARPVSLGKRA
jgi:hypothetical protein